MTSQLLRNTLTKSTHCFALLTALRAKATQLSLTMVPNKMGFLCQPITLVPSRRIVFARLYSSDKPGYLKAPQLETEEEDKKKLETEKENEEPLEKEAEEDIKNDEEGPGIAKLRELYNTDQKILIACVGDLGRAHCIASALGDASKIVVTSQYSCAGELERTYANARSHMLELEKLGARLVFNVDFMELAKDSRINHILYDRIILDQA